MSSALPSSFQKLVELFSHLPSVGEKSALRFASFLAQKPLAFTHSFAKALLENREKLSLCQNCFHYAEESLCVFCQNPRRKEELLCVVEHPLDIFWIEKSHAFSGKYHVLHGLLSPLSGKTPETLTIEALSQRVQKSPPQEILFALPPSPEGDTTIFYIARLLKNRVPKFTKLASGIPTGTLLEYTDTHTLAQALSHRVEVNI